MKFIVGVIIGILLTIGVVIFVVNSGFINMAATTKPSSLEERIGETLFERSMEKRAPQTKNPYATNNTEAVSSGMEHYQENCLVCHGAPGVKPSEIGQGLNPAAPALDEDDVREMSDGGLFWTVENGIRMTGMPAFGPTHSTDEIWTIVTFVRHLPELTDEQKNTLAATVAEEKGHHHEAEEQKPTQTQPQTQTQPHTHDDHSHD